MRRLRPLAALCLALSLLIGSVVQAVARNQMEGATDQVICGTSGLQTVQLDASGNPVTRTHPCTHCLAASATALPGTLAAAMPPDCLHPAERPRAAIPAPPIIPAHVPAARAPPPVV